MFPRRTQTQHSNSFDRFLLASIGQEDHSMPISVLSLFSRLDLDPPTEARILMMLPRSTAAEKLMKYILALPGNTLLEKKAKEQADFLVLLLPGMAAPGATKSQPPVTFGTLATAWLCSFIAIMILTLITHWAGTAWHHDPAESTTVVGEPSTTGHSAPRSANSASDHNAMMKPE
jgi:hypothetical protein